MQIVVYVIAGLFILLAAGLVAAFVRTRASGLLLIALAYAGSAGAAIALMSPWPLLAGFAAAWAMRLMGLDRDTARK